MAQLIIANIIGGIVEGIIIIGVLYLLFRNR